MREARRNFRSAFMSNFCKFSDIAVSDIAESGYTEYKYSKMSRIRNKRNSKIADCQNPRAKIDPEIQKKF